MLVDIHAAHAPQVITRNHTALQWIPIIPARDTTAPVAIMIMAIVIMIMIASTAHQQASSNKNSRNKFGH